MTLYLLTLCVVRNAVPDGVGVGRGGEEGTTESEGNRRQIQRQDPGTRGT